MRLLAGLALLALPGAALAGEVTIERPIVLAAGVGDEVAAYAIFANSGPETSIVAAECACAEALELHLINREGPRPTMTNDWPLALPASARIEIAPPGSPRHLMLIGLRQAIAPGETVALRFRLRDGEWIEADFVSVTDSAAAWGN
jgi:copper(I)-binding protein